MTVVEPEPGALRRPLGPELGEMFADLHREHGVTFRFGESVSEFRGSGGEVGGVTSSGGVVRRRTWWWWASARCPRPGWPPTPGLTSATACSSTPGCAPRRTDVFAAGDVANSFHPLFGRHVRVEHWANALNGGPAVARSMLGQGVSYDAVPYFFSDQYDLGMETAGLPEPGSYDQVVYRGDRDAREFVAFWLSGGSVVAGMNVNVWDVSDDIQALIRSRRQVDVARLADPDTPIATL